MLLAEAQSSRERKDFLPERNFSRKDAKQQRAQRVLDRSGFFLAKTQSSRERKGF